MATSLHFDERSLIKEFTTLNLGGRRVHEDELLSLKEKLGRMKTQGCQPIEASHDLSCLLARLLQSDISVQELRDLLDYRGGPQIHNQAHLGEIVLHWAVSQRRADVIAKLLDLGVDPFVPNSLGFSALYMARCLNDLASVRVLERSMAYFSAGVIIHGDGLYTEMKWMEVVPLVKEPSKRDWNFTILIRAYEQDLKAEYFWALKEFSLQEVSPQTSSFYLKNLISGEIKHLRVFTPQRGAFQKLNELLKKHCGREKIENVRRVATFSLESLFLTTSESLFLTTSESLFLTTLICMVFNGIVYYFIFRNTQF